jgi:uncharacterized membrane protein YedE/YeeE
MKANKFCIFRLFATLLAVAMGAGQGGGHLPLLAQQIEMIGARQWLGLMAGAIVATTPVLAPVSRRIAGSFARRAAPMTASLADDQEITSDAA